MRNSATKRQSGFNLLEIFVAMVIISLLTALAVPAYSSFIMRAKVAGAIGDMRSMSIEIDRFSLNNEDRLPVTLADLPMIIPLDPWGNNYQYLNIRTAGPGLGGVRKDGNLNPLNTDFDLYSTGKDGRSKSPLTAKHSRDDIVRANNGAFFGLAEDY